MVTTGDVIEKISSVITRAHLENMYEGMLVPQVDKRIREIVASNDGILSKEQLKKILEICAEISGKPWKKVL